MLDVFKSRECEVIIKKDAIDNNGKNRHIAICRKVQNHDYYRVKKLAEERFSPAVVVDIGAHIGTFSMLIAKFFPAARIYCFEPNKGVCDILVKNVPTADLYRIGIFGFYGAEENHPIHVGNNMEQTVRKKVKLPCTAVSAQEALVMSGLLNSKIDLLKIDCEQCEVNIFRELLFIDKLKDINIICGEWHRQTAKEEIPMLLGNTHEVELIDKGECNVFFATRKRNVTANT